MGVLLLLLVGVISQLTGGDPDRQGAICPATGSARIDPVGAAPGSQVVIIVTVDSPDTRCREVVRREPFLIVEHAAGAQEVGLRYQSGRYVTDLVLPADPWAIKLYVAENPNPVITLDPTNQIIVDPAESRSLFERTPGAFIIIGTALALIALAIIGSPANPRGRIRPSR